MSQNNTLTGATLRTPKAAAIAGIVFSVLLLLIFWLFRRAVPADPLEPGAWLVRDIRTAAMALNIIPFAGVAFLWFIGVIRDRLGQLEDRFFATVFFGSGLLFLAMLFASAAVLGAVIYIADTTPHVELISSTQFHFARSLSYIVMNIYAIKMAGVFMISTSTMIVYTAVAPRWIAIVGFVSAAFLLIGSYYVGWSVVVLPIWVLLLSAHIMIDNFRK